MAERSWKQRSHSSCWSFEGAVSAVAATLAQAFMTVGRPGVVASLQLISFLAGTALLMILVPIHGIYGAATALLIGTIIRLVVTLLCFPMVLGISMPRLWLSVDDLKVLLRVRATPSMQTSLGSEQSAARQPLISIGLPVYNGANFLEETLRSIASQTFTDFELIIADNASTDATASICLEFARLDPRVRYVRHPENVGAAANFNLVLELARAPLFKWHAHDDQLEPDFLERSVAALTADPGAILCITGGRLLDSQRGSSTTGCRRCTGPNSDSPASRFGAVVRTFYCHWTELYGVMRREAAAKTGLHRPFRGSDIAIVAELALLGRFARLDQPLVHQSRPCGSLFPQRRRRSGGGRPVVRPCRA